MLKNDKGVTIDTRGRESDQPQHSFTFREQRRASVQTHTVGVCVCVCTVRLGKHTRVTV